MTNKWDGNGFISGGLAMLLLIFFLVVMVAVFVSVAVGALLVVGLLMVVFAPTSCKPFIIMFMLLGALVLIFVLGIGAR